MVLCQGDTEDKRPEGVQAARLGRRQQPSGYHGAYLFHVLTHRGQRIQACWQTLGGCLDVMPRPGIDSRSRQGCLKVPSSIGSTTRLFCFCIVDTRLLACTHGLLVNLELGGRRTFPTMALEAVRRPSVTPPLVPVDESMATGAADHRDVALCRDPWRSVRCIGPKVPTANKRLASTAWMSTVIVSKRRNSNVPFVVFYSFRLISHRLFLRLLKRRGLAYHLE